MKTNILTNMKEFAKYICTVVMMLGMSVNVWGTMYTDTDLSVEVELEDGEAYGSFEFTLKNSYPGYTLVNGPSDYGYIVSELDDYDYATAVFDDNTSDNPDNWGTQYGTKTMSVDYYFDAPGDYEVTLIVKHQQYANGGTVYDTQNFTISFSVTGDCPDLSSTHMDLNTVTPIYNTTTSEWDATVSWDAVEGATRYGLRLQYYDDETSKWKNAADWVYTTSSSYTMTNLTEDTKYRVGVQGQNVACSTGTAGDITNEFTPHCDKPATTTVTTTSISSTGVTVNWGSVSGASNYAVMITNEAEDENVSGTQNVTPPTTTKTFTGLTPNTNYYAALQISNDCGQSRIVLSSMFTTLQRYAITYYKNDGGATSGVEYKDHGVNYTISSDKYTRSGYTLLGWNTEDDGDGTDYDKGETYTGNAALSLYAVWGGTISFNANGGTGSMDAELIENGDTYVLPDCGFTAPSGKYFDGWAEGSSSGTKRAVGYEHTVAGDITFYAKWRDPIYTDYKFSCADWELIGPSGDIVFITSAASKTVRSQEAFHVSGSGLPHSTALTFTTFPVNTKFEFKKADGTVPATDTYGVVDADVYVFYTPDAEDTSDGLDEITSLTVSVTGEPRMATIDTKRVIGRHLPSEFVIAGKKDGKWWAMPSDMASTTNPTPVEIAVNDATNPSIAYTVSSTYYGLAGPTVTNISDENGQYIRFAMSIDDGTLDPHAAPLFGTTGTTLGKSGSSQITSDLSAGNWWKLVQTNTSITNPQDAKYTICCANNTQSLTIEDGGKWGLYATNGTDVDELRLIPASTVVPTEAYFVEWSQYGGVVEVDAQGVGATKVQAVLNGTESVVKTLIQTKASDAKNKTSKYNYTINFNDLGKEIDFADAESNGAMLTLRWLDNSEDLVAVSNITVPKIIASNTTTMSSIESGDTPWSKWEVHVLPGVTLTANAGDFSSKDVIINQLEIYPGATVKVTKGAQDVGTLKVKTLVLRNGWTRVGEKAYDVARLYVPTDANLAKSAVGDVWYSDWYIDYDQYYPIAVPFPVATSSISYKNTTSAASAGVKLRYYSGELRAEHVQQNQADNWVEYTWGVGGTMPATLEPSKGYIMTAKRPTGKAFSIVRMPLTFSNEWTTAGEQGVVSETHKDQVTVTAWGNENTPSYAKGWNIIANPYMSLHQGALSYDDESGEVIEYANIPDINFKEYDQLPIDATKLKPSSAFLVQAPKDGTVTFGTTNRQASAPSYRREVQAETLPTQRAYIVLANDEAEDMMGILVSDKYSAEYEINADLEKLMGDGKSLRTYMHWNEMKMAYLAINKELAQQWIPVSVRIETEGEHTFSMHSASKISELKGVYLIDFETGAVTNLLESSYPFYSTAGTINNRFAINAVIGPRDVPTELDIVRDGNEGSGPIKFIYHDKVFILHEGVIYDSTGKKVREIKK